MPIDKKEFQDGKDLSRIEDDILVFLKERKENAFTSHEIMEGVNFHTTFTTFETTRISTFATADFTTLLHELVSKGKIKSRIVEGQMYFATAAEGEGVAKCPKCGTLITQPEKTWKMTGRPNKKGQRLQLTIGLFICPRHGAFRKALGKKRI